MAGAGSHPLSLQSEGLRLEADPLLLSHGALILPLPGGRSVPTPEALAVSLAGGSGLYDPCPPESTRSRRRYLARRHPHSAAGESFGVSAEPTPLEEAERT